MWIGGTGYGSKFRAAATAIERAFPEMEVLGNAKGKPRSGAFEVTSEDGTVFWSKLGNVHLPPHLDAPTSPTSSP